MTGWMKGIGGSTQGVQSAYVNVRMRAINGSKKRESLFEETLQELRKLPRYGKKVHDAVLADAYFRMQEALQKSPLTINIKAPSWFSSPNPYETYTQMYERAVKNGRMVLTDADPANPAYTRAGVDDFVTFPKSWLDVKATAAGATYNPKPASGPTRGLSPSAMKDRLVGKMSPGKLVASDGVSAKGKAETQYTASNSTFDPMSKQLFTALDYGHRPHGATTAYGHSYLVLAERYKTRAIYFAGDTFYALQGYKNSADDQITFDMLGAVYCKANQHLQGDLVSACLDSRMLSDTAEVSHLLEAHVFEELKFTGGITDVVISMRDGVKDGDSKITKPLTQQEWKVIRANAQAFAQKHGARLVVAD